MKRFDFGENWKEFSEQNLDAGRFDAARDSLHRIFGASIEGASFLDVGFGTGLFSLAAKSLGAGRVLGVDRDAGCLEAAERNRAAFGMAAEDVRFGLADALDAGAMGALGEFDIVYAWGSLHHTGEMWRAIRIASERVGPRGRLMLAIYNRHWTSPAWTAVKWTHNRLPRVLRPAWDRLWAAAIYAAKFAAATRRNPLVKERGMDFYRDVIDWIGGYPYEYASADEVRTRMESMGFRQVAFWGPSMPIGCNEFLFERTEGGLL